MFAKIVKFFKPKTLGDKIRENMSDKTQRKLAAKRKANDERIKNYTLLRAFEKIENEIYKHNASKVILRNEDHYFILKKRDYYDDFIALLEEQDLAVIDRWSTHIVIGPKEETNE